MKLNYRNFAATTVNKALNKDAPKVAPISAALGGRNGSDK